MEQNGLKFDFCVLSELQSVESKCVYLFISQPETKFWDAESVSAVLDTPIETVETALCEIFKVIRG